MVDTAEADGAAGVSVSGEARAMFAAYRAAADSAGRLAAAELRLAASTVVLLLALGIVIALLLATAWMLAMAAVAAAIVGLDAWPASLAGVASANLVAALAAWWWVNALTPNLTFQELRALLGRARSDTHGSNAGEPA
jgi:hypothetical protein